MVVERQTSTTNFSKKLDHWIPNMIDRLGLMRMFALCVVPLGFTASPNTCHTLSG